VSEDPRLDEKTFFKDMFFSPRKTGFRQKFRQNDQSVKDAAPYKLIYKYIAYYNFVTKIYRSR